MHNTAEAQRHLHSIEAHCPVECIKLIAAGKGKSEKCIEEKEGAAVGVKSCYWSSLTKWQTRRQLWRCQNNTLHITSKQFVTATRISVRNLASGPWTANCACTAREDVLLGSLGRWEQRFWSYVQMCYFMKTYLCLINIERSSSSQYAKGQIRQQIRKKCVLVCFWVPCVAEAFRMFCLIGVVL